jgi:GNAT superfamily N-acetyltransferase
MEWSRDGYTISDAQEAVDVDAVFDFLSTTYWGAGMLREVCERSLRNSLCFSLLHQGRLVGFCRVVTDRAIIAYLVDVYVLPEHRGRGLADWLIACVRAHPELQRLRRWILVTADAHGLYAKHGFAPPENPEIYMDIFRPNDALD